MVVTLSSMITLSLRTVTFVDEAGSLAAGLQPCRAVDGHLIVFNDNWSVRVQQESLQSCCPPKLQMSKAFLCVDATATWRTLPPLHGMSSHTPFDWFASIDFAGNFTSDFFWDLGMKFCVSNC